MSLSSFNIYRSQNGDVWRLIKSEATNLMFIRHEANPASGGHVTEMSIEEFLSCNGSGPEYAATRELLRNLPHETEALTSSALSR
ncbi:hypothetical protein [Pseudoroseomonas ludipueritiae]|uniref:Uncharacterized protein n=1 Tax=Pseudoroseomonas ludipueritiae TaxID=198093 RepID=A0ABR7R3E9_9PROT|nr:hypothetical protein [Pseudoroseomonas ludipueritiae]MBC9176177.1 hypothetical protein [Pseudoroseomonas ludipueritiae]